MPCAPDLDRRAAVGRREKVFPCSDGGITVAALPDERLLERGSAGYLEFVTADAANLVSPKTPARFTTRISGKFLEPVVAAAGAIGGRHLCPASCAGQSVSNSLKIRSGPQPSLDWIYSAGTAVYTLSKHAWLRLRIVSGRDGWARSWPQLDERGAYSQRLR